MKSILRHKKQEGITLVETMVGLVVLTIGISTALGLAVSILTQTTKASKQVVAIGLAREGVEAVFNIRATNWLNSDLDSNCHNFDSGLSDGYCRPDWLIAVNDISSGEGELSRLDTVVAQGLPTFDVEYWQMDHNPASYRLYATNDLSSGYLYTHDPALGVDSGYYRQISITEVDDFPYDQDIGPKILVRSRVWWNERKCPSTEVWLENNGCSVELTTYLTNWRNY